jgi:hypothetical protein
MDMIDQVKQQEREDRSRPFIAVREFWTDATTKKDGTIVCEDFVSWVKKGQTIQDEARSKIRYMPKYFTLEWEVIEPLYKKWKDGQETEIENPLTGWPGATKSLVKVLSQVHIRSIDDFCDMEDSAVSNLAFPGIRKMQQDCRQFRDAQKNMAPLAAELSKTKEENAYLRSELDELRRAVESLSADEPPKRGPGRPKKIQEDEAA